MQKDHKRIIELVSIGFYNYLKSNGYLKKDPAREQKIEKLLEDTRRIRQGGVDSA